MKRKGFVQPELTFPLMDMFVKAQAKKNKEIIYGAQSVAVKIGPFARGTFDYDVMSTKPKSSAKQLERTLDTSAQGDYFYTQPSKFHKGTYKVYYKGQDYKKGTKDDLAIVDYTKTKRGIQTRTISGIKYAKLSETAKDKRRALGQKQYEFRWQKDREDLERIKAARRLGR